MEGGQKKEVGADTVPMMHTEKTTTTESLLFAILAF